MREHQCLWSDMNYRCHREALGWLLTHTALLMPLSPEPDPHFCSPHPFSANHTAHYPGTPHCSALSPNWHDRGSCQFLQTSSCPASHQLPWPWPFRPSLPASLRSHLTALLLWLCPPSPAASVTLSPCLAFPSCSWPCTHLAVTLSHPTQSSSSFLIPCPNSPCPILLPPAQLHLSTRSPPPCLSFSTLLSRAASCMNCPPCTHPALVQIYSSFPISFTPCCLAPPPLPQLGWQWEPQPSCAPPLPSTATLPGPRPCHTTSSQHPTRLLPGTPLGPGFQIWDKSPTSGSAGGARAKDCPG